MGFGFKQPLVGEKRCVTTLITAAEETKIRDAFNLTKNSRRIPGAGANGTDILRISVPKISKNQNNWKTLFHSTIPAWAQFFQAWISNANMADPQASQYQCLSSKVQLSPNFFRLYKFPCFPDHHCKKIIVATHRLLQAFEPGTFCRKLIPSLFSPL